MGTESRRGAELCLVMRSGRQSKKVQYHFTRPVTRFFGPGYRLILFVTSIATVILPVLLPRGFQLFGVTVPDCSYPLFYLGLRGRIRWSKVASNIVRK